MKAPPEDGVVKDTFLSIGKEIIEKEVMESLATTSAHVMVSTLCL